MQVPAAHSSCPLEPDSSTVRSIPVGRAAPQEATGGHIHLPRDASTYITVSGSLSPFGPITMARSPPASPGDLKRSVAYTPTTFGYDSILHNRHHVWRYPYSKTVMLCDLWMNCSHIPDKTRACILISCLHTATDAASLPAWSAKHKRLRASRSSSQINSSLRIVNVARSTSSDFKMSFHFSLRKRHTSRSGGRLRCAQVWHCSVSPSAPCGPHSLDLHSSAD